MTEKLKTLMERAADLDFDAVDLAAIVESGDRAVRRRRASVIGGVAALTLAAGGVAVALGGGDAARDRAPVTGSLAPEVSWVVGDTLHTATASYDLGRTAVAYVRTRAGYAFLDDDGRVFSLVDGEVAEIGAGARGQSPLVGDENGSVVGWVDRSGDVPAFVTVDLATGEQQRHEDHLDASMAGGEPPHLAWIFAIDDGTAYWLDLRGEVATDLGTGESRLIAFGDDVQWIGDVTAGLRVGLVERGGGADVGTDLRDRDDTVVLPASEDRFYGVVSPDGRWVTTADGSIVEVASGEEHPIAGADRADALFAYEWLDDDTAVVLAERGSGIELLTCEAPSGGCSTVTTIEGTDQLVLPVGGYLTEMLTGTGEGSVATGTEGAPATD